jgi:hypothetical protein
MTELNKLKIANIKGPQGNGAVIRGSLTNITELPTETPEGAIYAVGDTNIIYIYKNKKWVQLYKILGHVDTVETLPTGTENAIYTVGTDNNVYIFTTTWELLGKLLGNKASVSELPNLQEGDLYLVGDNNTLYSYSKSTWINCGNIQGKQGEQGIQGISKLNLLIVSKLPDVGQEDTEYFIKSTDGSGDNLYDEYVWIHPEGESAKFEKIGQSKIDFSNFYTKTESDNKYATISQLQTIENKINSIISRIG